MINSWSMKKGSLTLRVMLAFLVASLVGCGGGNNDSPAPLPITPPPSSNTGTVTGRVLDNTTNVPISDALVTAGAVSVTTDVNGTFALAGVPAAERVVVNIKKQNYVQTTRIVRLDSGATTAMEATFLPVTYSTTINTAQAVTVTVPTSVASVTLPANALVRQDGSSAQGSVTAELTPVDPSFDTSVFPGDLTTLIASTQQERLIESYGAVNIRFSDSTGQELKLGTGQTATIRIPVAIRVAAGAPATIPLYYYDIQAGRWIEEGSTTLQGTAPNLYYEGTVSHFSYWNADMLYDTATITGMVHGCSGQPVGGAVVTTTGVNYIGNDTAYSAADGTFAVRARANSNATVIAYHPDNGLSNTAEVINTGVVSGSFPLVNVLSACSQGGGTATIRLTWASQPDDLDSHLTGPVAGSATTRFHTYFADQGSLAALPYASLDVDDVDGFGPEVITLAQFTPGIYRYSVHHYSGTSTIASSPASVRLTLDGRAYNFTPPLDNGGGGNNVWQVFEIAVAADGTKTVNPLGTWDAQSAVNVRSLQIKRRK